MNSQTPENAKKTYIAGFILSVALTLAAYMLVIRHVDSNHLEYSHRTLIAAVMGLAVIQLFVQLMFFLHLGRESKPRWNLLVFSMMALVLIIVVAGSLWIMHNLDYRMSPSQMDQYLKDQESGGI